MRQVPSSGTAATPSGHAGRGGDAPIRHSVPLTCRRTRALCAVGCITYGMLSTPSPCRTRAIGLAVFGLKTRRLSARRRTWSTSRRHIRSLDSFFAPESRFDSPSGTACGLSSGRQRTTSVFGFHSARPPSVGHGRSGPSTPVWPASLKASREARCRPDGTRTGATSSNSLASTTPDASRVICPASGSFRPCSVPSASTFRGPSSIARGAQYRRSGGGSDYLAIIRRCLAGRYSASRLTAGAGTTCRPATPGLKRANSFTS